MKIGSLVLENQVILAPMAGVTDSAFRLLAREMGCALVFSEMVSAKGTVLAPGKSLILAEFSPGERPIGIQLFGSEPDYFARAAAVISTSFSPDLIDINMGCPVKKVAGKGEGCALMKDPAKASEIVRRVVAEVDIPVTVKMRKGWDDDRVNAVEIALAVQEAGAAAVTVHGRTREQGYSGQADWSIIARVREKVHIPVIGNGDVASPQAARRMLAETGCDAVMIGRAALGNPWLLHRTVCYLKTGNLPKEPDISEIVSMAGRHLRLIAEKKGEYSGVREMRKHLAWYIRGMPRAAMLRDRIMRAVTEEEMMAILWYLR